jgi:hypothetical protein
MKQKDNDNPYLKMLLFGQPGSGKTTLAASISEVYRTFYIDIAGNTETLRKTSYKPDVYALEKIEELNVVYDYFAKGQPTSHPLAQKFNISEPYEAIVIDSITEVQLWYISLLAKDSVDLSKPVEISQRTYGDLLKVMSKVAGLFFKLDLHVIFTTQEQPEFSAEGEIINYVPSLVGKSLYVVPSYANVVARIFTTLESPVPNLRKIARQFPTADRLCLTQPVGGITGLKNQYNDKDMLVTMKEFMIV